MSQSVGKNVPMMLPTVDSAEIDPAAIPTLESGAAA